jgi:hypothetical protein
MVTIRERNRARLVQVSAADTADACGPYTIENVAIAAGADLNVQRA